MLSTTPDSPLVLSYLHTALIDAVFFPVLLAWIDSTIRVAADRDLLRRDTLYWSKLRKPIWTAIGVSILLGLIGVTEIVSELPWEALLYGPFFAVLPYASVVLVVSVARARDPSFRGHLRWFAYFMVTMVIIMVLYIPRISLLLSIGFVFGSYFLYRMAKSLAPISRLPPD
jgi:heme A synthase